MPYSDPARQRDYQRRWNARRRAEWLEGRCCADCGSTNDLELDHVVPGEKVEHRVWTWTRVRRERELAKCVARCRRCHVAKGVRSGELRRSAILVPDDVIAIRAMRGRMRTEELAANFGVSQWTIRDVLAGRSWREIGTTFVADQISRAA